jgi:Mrp family chromosome partitioning ATPase
VSIDNVIDSSIDSSIDRAEPDDELTVRQYFAPALRRWPLVLIPIVALPVIVGFVSRVRTVEYTARSSVLVLEPVPEVVLVGRDFVPNSRTRTLRDEAEFAAGDLVRAEVRARLQAESPARVEIGDLSVPGGRVQPQTNLDVLVFLGTGSSAPWAGTVADTWAQAYIDLSRDRTIEQLDQSIAAVEDELAGAMEARDEVAADLDLLEAELARTVDVTARRDLERRVAVERTRIGPELDLAQASVDSLATALDQLALRRGIADSGGDVLLRRSAPLTTSSDALRWWLAGAASLIVGAVFGLAAAMAAAMADRRVLGPRDVTEVGAQLLATVPWRVGKGPISAPSHDRLGSALGFTSVDGDLKTVMLTGPQEGDEAARTSLRLAVTYLTAGRSVVLVETDLRNQRLHRAVDIAPDAGAGVDARGRATSAGADARAGAASAVAVDDRVEVRPVAIKLSSVGPDSGRFAVVPAGALPTGRGDMLSVPRVIELIDRWSEVADVVIVDGPPILPRSEAIALASQVDGVVVVARSGSTIKADLAAAISTLEATSTKVFGVALIDDGLPLKRLRRSLGQALGRLTGGR